MDSAPAPADDDWDDDLHPAPYARPDGDPRPFPQARGAAAFGAATAAPPARPARRGAALRSPVVLVTLYAAAGIALVVLAASLLSEGMSPRDSEPGRQASDVRRATPEPAPAKPAPAQSDADKAAAAARAREQQAAFRRAVREAVIGERRAVAAARAAHAAPGPGRGPPPRGAAPAAGGAQQQRRARPGRPAGVPSGARPAGRAASPARERRRRQRLRVLHRLTTGGGQVLHSVTDCPRLDALPGRDLPGGLRLAEARSRAARMKGLAQLDAMPPTAALHIPRCRSVHTFTMRFPLDLIWLGRSGEVVRVDRAVPPRRLRACVRARSVVEANAGTADAFVAAGLSPERDGGGAGDDDGGAR